MVKISIVKKTYRKSLLFKIAQVWGKHEKKRGFTIDDAIVIKKNVHNFSLLKNVMP